MKRKNRPARRAKKRPYRAPALRTYGDLKALTSAKRGNRMDGTGVPKTRTVNAV
jgi:hypothetical protein